MSNPIRNFSLVIATAVALSACGAKQAATSGGAPGSYQGVPTYPGASELMTHDTPAGPGATLHSGNYRSNDRPEQIHAYFKEQLTRLFGERVSDDTQGEGIVKLMGGDENRTVTVLIHAGDSGEQVIGIQVISKN